MLQVAPGPSGPPGVPPPQTWQAAPPWPHWAAVCCPAGTQVAPSQQPFGQLVASQTHCPPWQCCPGAQATQAPPPVPHWASVGGETQLDPSQQPSAQATQFPPQAVVPAGQAVQRGAAPGPLAVQTSPAQQV
jgi:hypothetical protein